ncbi:hypothetical protein M569_11320, partial [Genlisea aurea]
AATHVAAADAPPKQVAQALEQLGKVGRLIADVRIGTDRLLEALMMLSEESHGQHMDKCLNLIVKEDSMMHGYLHKLSAIGKQLEESGVLSDSFRLRCNTWGLHMPLVSPDGAVVAYAWKRQLAGQAGASAVERTRLALKAFKDQKKRFFPHLDDDSVFERPAKHCSHEELGDGRTLADVLSHLEKEIPDLQIYAHRRLDWLKRALELPYSPSERSLHSSKDHSFPGTSKWGEGAVSTTAHVSDKAAVIELLLPSIFRAVVSLHTEGSMDPDAVAFFSPDE